MIYLILAVTSSMLVSVIMRVSEKHIHNNITMLASNYLMCSVLAAICTGTWNLFPVSAEGFPFSVGLGLISGLFYMGSFMLLQWNVKTNGIVLSSMFMKLGVMVPTLMAILVFGEVPKAVQVIGMIVALAAILLINLEKGSGMADIPAMIAYPTYSVAAIVMVTLVGVIFFKEKLSRRQILSMFMIFAALVLLNI